MKISTFDKRNLQDLRNEITAALETVGKKYGINITAGSARYTGDSATFKVELATVTASGDVISKEASAFKQSCLLYNLKPTDLFATITHGGVQYKLMGLAGGRSYRFPFIAQRLSDGKTFKLPESAVKALQTGKSQTPTVSDFVVPTAHFGICQNDHAMLRTAKGVEVGKCDQNAQTTRKTGGLNGAKVIKVCLTCADLIDSARRENEAEARCS